MQDFITSFFNSTLLPFIKTFKTIHTCMHLTHIHAHVQQGLLSLNLTINKLSAKQILRLKINSVNYW